MTPEQMVREFHERYGHLVSPDPTVRIPEPVKQLRKDLIKEEYEELMGAMFSNNLVEIADGIADLVYVLVGTAISYGIPFDRVLQEVHRSNMTKTPVRVENGQKYGTGIPKGPFYVAPQISKILCQPKFKTELEER